MRELPYDFDLLYDVKSYAQIESIANYKWDCSDATPEELVLLFQQLELEIPSCLIRFAPIVTVWLECNGCWQSHEPDVDELHKFRKTTVKGW